VLERGRDRIRAREPTAGREGTLAAENALSGSAHSIDDRAPHGPDRRGQLGAARVVGTAGGARKADLLVKTFGFDAAIGLLHTEETIVDWLEHAPRALMEVLRGGNTGKMLVHVG
jgi:hypothetical protein